MTDNAYRGICIHHRYQIGSFCPDCIAFRCPECKDPHVARMIPNWLIDDYLKALCIQQSNGPQPSTLKQTLTKKYEEVLNATKETLSSIHRQIDIQVGGSSTVIEEIQKMKITDSALQALKSLAVSNKEFILAKGEHELQLSIAFFTNACNAIINSFTNINYGKPSKTSDIGFESAVIESTKCSVHASQNVEFYCQKHNVWYCSKCIKAHQECGKIAHFEDIIEEMKAQKCEREKSNMKPIKQNDDIVCEGLKKANTIKGTILSLFNDLEKSISQLYRNNTTQQSEKPNTDRVY